MQASTALRGIQDELSAAASLAVVAAAPDHVEGRFAAGAAAPVRDCSTALIAGAETAAVAADAAMAAAVAAAAAVLQAAGQNLRQVGVGRWRV